MIHIYTIHVYINIYVYIYVHICIHTHVCIYRYAHTHICIHTLIHKRADIKIQIVNTRQQLPTAKMSDTLHTQHSFNKLYSPFRKRAISKQGSFGKETYVAIANGKTSNKLHTQSFFDKLYE